MPDLRLRTRAGPPPLGPGAEPAARLVAFLDAYADYLSHALLAPLAADQRMALRDEVGRERVKAGLARLVRSIVEGERT